MLNLMPPSIEDRAPREGDERFNTITARRPVLEQTLWRAAEAQAGLEIRRGVSVRELLLTKYNGTPHVNGIRTASGEELHADLVVDAMGRRSRLPLWLQVTAFTDTGERLVKRLRDRAVWTALVSACPRHAQWLDGEPITEVLPMAGAVDRYRRSWVGEEPVATGVAAVGDTCACTNPSNRRGMSLGLMHVQCLRDVVRKHLDDPLEFAEAWDAVTESELTPWYRENLEEDRDRIAKVAALRSGVLVEPEPGFDSRVAVRAALRAALPYDADAFRVQVAWRSCLTRLEDAFANQEFVERILEIARDCERPPLAGPNQSQLLELLTRTTGAPAVRPRVSGSAGPSRRCRSRRAAAPPT
jgi:hypothetical protein